MSLTQHIRDKASNAIILFDFLIFLGGGVCLDKTHNEGQSFS